jgi:peptide/nickel transport system permease protein
VKYVTRRLLYLIPTLLLVSMIIFFLMRILPGDVATLMLVGPEGTGTPTHEQIAKLNAQMGLNRPLVVQYLDWMGNLLRGRAGTSFWTNRPVMQELLSRLPLTLELGLLTTVIGTALAIPLGVLAAVNRGNWIDYFSRVFAIGGLAIPSFWAGILIILALEKIFGWTAPLGYSSLFKNPRANLSQMILPALALGYAHAALVSRLVRSSLLEVMREDYIRTARSKGLKGFIIIVRHALRNSMLPVITVIGLGLAAIFGGTVIMETVFSLPGVGRFMVDAINHRDFPVVQTLTFLFAIVYMLVNLAVDVTYGILDPRLRVA